LLNMFLCSVEVEVYWKGCVMITLLEVDFLNTVINS